MRAVLVLLAAIASAVATQGCASSDRGAQQPTNASTASPTLLPESTVATTAVSWFNPTVRQSGPAAEVIGDSAGRFWASVTGLDGPTSNGAWQERLEAACAAPIWDYAAAAELADGFVLADGGDPEAPASLPEGRSLRDEAIWALWTMVNNGDWCAASFPPASLHIATWLNLTGLRGPVDLAVWEHRLDRACSIGEEDVDEWRRLAAEFVEADGDDVADSASVDGAADALRLMLRQQVLIGSDASDDPEDMTPVPVHACD